MAVAADAEDLQINAAGFTDDVLVVASSCGEIVARSVGSEEGVGAEVDVVGELALDEGAVGLRVAGFESDEFGELVGATFDMLDTASGTDMITTDGVFFAFEWRSARENCQNSAAK